MAKRKTPSRGSKPDKIMRDAIVLELNEEVDVRTAEERKKKGSKPNLMKKLRLVARALVNQGIKGDVPAIREIDDRVDGKLTQKVMGPGKDGAIPIDIKNLSHEQLESLKARLLAGAGLGSGRRTPGRD